MKTTKERKARGKDNESKKVSWFESAISSSTTLRRGERQGNVLPRSIALLAALASCSYLYHRNGDYYVPMGYNLLVDNSAPITRLRTVGLEPIRDNHSLENLA